MTTREKTRPPVAIHGVAIGGVAGIAADGAPLIRVPAITGNARIKARSTVPIGPDDVGAAVALMFEGGDPAQPLIIGLIVNPEDAGDAVEVPNLRGTAATVSRDGGPDEVVSLEAKERLVLKCGRASITLTKAGKVLIRGAYVSSRSSGVNRIKGGSVHIN